MSIISLMFNLVTIHISNHSDSETLEVEAIFIWLKTSKKQQVTYDKKFPHLGLRVILVLNFKEKAQISQKSLILVLWPP